MIRIVVTLLCLTAPVFSWWDTNLEKGFKIRYDVNPISMVTGTSFMDLPQSIESAKKKGWEQTAKPDDLHAEYSSLDLWCSKCNEVCVLFDDTEYPAGILITFNMTQYTNVLYSLTTQGFKKWDRIDKNGKSEEFMWTVIYFESPEYLKKSKEDRIAARDPESLLQDDCIYVSGINGELHRISTDETEIADTETSNFTLQACMPWMGHHYYYLMTENLECNDQLFPFFPLVFNGKLIGLGFVGYGKYTTLDGCTDYFEKPSKTAIKVIVPRGPDCLYDLADDPGVITSHVYFIDNPTSMLCLPKLW